MGGPSILLSAENSVLAVAANRQMDDYTLDQSEDKSMRIRKLLGLPPKYDANLHIITNQDLKSVLSIPVVNDL